MKCRTALERNPYELRDGDGTASSPDRAPNPHPAMPLPHPNPRRAMPSPHPTRTQPAPNPHPTMPLPRTHCAFVSFTAHTPLAHGPYVRAARRTRIRLARRELPKNETAFFKRRYQAVLTKRIDYVGCCGCIGQLEKQSSKTVQKTGHR